MSRQITDRHLHLLEKRVEEPAFHPHGQQEILSLSSQVFSLLRTSIDGTSKLLSLVNVASTPLDLSLSLHKLGMTFPKLVDLVSGRTLSPEDSTLNLNLAGYQVLWLKGVG